MKVIILASGGIDSTVLAYKLANENHKVEAISFNYGQRHVKELQIAHKLMKELGVKHQTIDISNIAPLINSPLINRSTITYPFNGKLLETAEHTIIPNRNAILISITTGYAINNKFDGIGFAAHRSDTLTYPDCRPQFINALQLALQLGNEAYYFKIVSPFVELTKGDIIKLGKELGVKFKNTWSCYKGGEKHCGVCVTCLERKRAFKEAKIQDPTEYVA